MQLCFVIFSFGKVVFKKLFAYVHVQMYIPFVQASANRSDSALCFLEATLVVGNQ